MSDGPAASAAARGLPVEYSGFYSQLTGSGPAAIAVVRIFGDDTPAALQHLIRASWLATTLPSRGAVRRAILVDPDGRVLDDILVSFHRDDARDVQLHLHGSPWVVRDLCDRLAALGFRDVDTIEPRQGESFGPFAAQAADSIENAAFELLPRMPTLRGAKWLIGAANALRQVLHQLKSAGDLAMARDLVARVALDGPQVVESFARPLRIALVGPPNAGKSTLLNALADQAVSIVSGIPGTTRDWVEIPAEVDGFPVAWIDTAGLRGGAAPLEAAGIARTHEIAAAADRVALVLDGAADGLSSAAPFLGAYAGPPPHCVAITKADRPDFTEAGIAAALLSHGFGSVPRVSISATDGSGISEFALLAAAPPRFRGFERIGPCAFTELQVRYLGGIVDSNAVSDVRIIAQRLLQMPNQAR